MLVGRKLGKSSLVKMSYTFVECRDVETMFDM